MPATAQVSHSIDYSSGTSSIGAWRELSGYHHRTDPIGPEPVAAAPDTRAAWHEAFAALGPTDGPDVRALPDGTLLHLRDTYPLETAWAPQWVGDEVRQVRTGACEARLAAIRASAEATAAHDRGEHEDAARHQHTVTFWEALSEDGDQHASVSEIADVLVKLHSLTAPDDLHLSELSPFANTPQRIAASTWLSPDDRAFLTGMLAQMRDAYAQLEFALPPGVIHGDASIGNVLRDSHGHPVVIDLDGFATGPREWDLALTAIYYDSFGWHTHQEYQDFARVYGYDIMTWPG